MKAATGDEGKGSFVMYHLMDMGYIGLGTKRSP